MRHAVRGWSWPLARASSFLPPATLGLAALALACGSSSEPSRTASDLELYVAAEHAPALEWYVASLAREDVAVRVTSDPLGAARAGAGRLRVGLVADLDCGECWRVDGDGAQVVVVHGGDRLGLQYGLSELLEGMGFRFHHPKRYHAPPEFAFPEMPAEGALRVPRQHTRGLQLHTLHPIEALWDFWVPGEEHLASARRTMDWLVKNRGNFLHWVALNDIVDEEVRGPWQEHTRALTAHAHLLGLRASIGVQLFGTSSLQRSYILAPTPAPGFEANLEAALAPVVDGNGFDHLAISFGEFSAAPPEALLSGVNTTYEALQRVSPGATMSGTIHVGGDVTVTWQGREMVYYFLVEYARPEVIPWVHTVMYYNLFEDAGGAYHHENFHEHRDFLLRRLVERKPVSYHPESAYWVSFDNSVPTYLPLYVRSRWLDLARVEEERLRLGGAPLEDQVNFSSGWEWGYWQQDVATLRMGVSIPGRWEEWLGELFAPHGAPSAAPLVAELAERQHRALIQQRLAPYFAGRDDLIDVGDRLDIRSQPDRPTYEEVLAFDEAALGEHETAVVEPLEAFADDLAALHDRVLAAGWPEDPFLDEIVDGFAVNRERSRFVAECQRALLAWKRTGTDGGRIAAAEAALARGQEVVSRRHARFHDERGGLLTERTALPTLYQYGYLHHADSLCLWRRELGLLKRATTGERGPLPGCSL